MNAGSSGFRKSLFQIMSIPADGPGTDRHLASPSSPHSLLSPSILETGGAPITKAITIAVLFSSISIQISRNSARHTPRLLNVATKYFAFAHPGELLFGLSLCYYYRIFERQLGSVRYGSFAVTTWGMSMVLQALFLRLLGKESATGPYPLIFANLVNFVLDIPHLHSFNVLGLRMTDKAFIYLLGLQLLLASAQRSIAAGAAGLAAGLLHRLNFLGVASFQPPAFLTNFIKNTVGSLFVGPGYKGNYVFHSPPQQQGNVIQQVAATEAVAAEAVPLVPVEPNPEAIDQLVSMGFERNRVVEALRRSQNNVEMALQYLL